MTSWLPATNISRRDFISGTLVGAGAVLIGGCGPSSSGPETETLDPDVAWNGPSGVGDYAGSNGNTLRTARAAHAIRDGDYAGSLSAVHDEAETYDVIIVGGGFTGLGALHEFRRSKPDGKALLLDNQEIFGGYGKSNAFRVAGLTLQGPQASLNFLLPQTKEDRGAAYWEELALPRSFPVVEQSGGNRAIRFARSTSGPLYLGEQSASVGYWFGKQSGFVKDIWADDLARAPFPPETRQAPLNLRARKRLGKPEGDEARRLDSMTFADFAKRELGATPAALRYITDGMCITGPQISAYGAHSLPGLEQHAPGSKEAAFAKRFQSFPDGNALIARAFVRSAIPTAFPHEAKFDDLAESKLDVEAIDRRGQVARIRQRATVVRVAHLGDPGSAELVEVVYANDRQLTRVRARGIVMAIGSWVAKHIVADLPEDHRAAFNRFLYSPMLMITSR